MFELDIMVAKKILKTDYDDTSLISDQYTDCRYPLDYVVLKYVWSKNKDVLHFCLSRGFTGVLLNM